MKKPKKEKKNRHKRFEKREIVYDIKSTLYIYYMDGLHLYFHRIIMNRDAINK